jgi:hypothetical protein
MPQQHTIAKQFLALPTDEVEQLLHDRIMNATHGSSLCHRTVRADAPTILSGPLIG